MELSEFKNKFLSIYNDIDENKIEQFYRYMELLIEWNKKINLTAIIEPNDIIVKHFLDSITIEKYIEKEDSNILDIGTGAGFPGIPLKIMKPEADVVLIDAVNKKINFLNEVIRELNLNLIKTIHTRAEDLAAEKEYRENFDFVTSRAVSNLTTLSEYMLPFCKIGGYSICMKGPGVKEEIEESKKAIEILGGKLEKIDSFTINDEYERNIVIIKKIKATPAKYPRKQGKPLKEPIK